MRGEEADEDAGGADADDRGAFAEQARQQGLRVLAVEAAMVDAAARRGGDAHAPDRPRRPRM